MTNQLTKIIWQQIAARALFTITVLGLALAIALPTHAQLPNRDDTSSVSKRSTASAIEGDRISIGDLARTFCKGGRLQMDRASNTASCTSSNPQGVSKLGTNTGSGGLEAKIDLSKCKLVNGVMKCSHMDCSLDNKGGCDHFITMCVGKGGTVSGNNNSASCDF